MIVYLGNVFYDQCSFSLVAMEIFNLKERNVLNDNSFKTNEAKWFLFGTNVAWVREIQNS